MKTREQKIEAIYDKANMLYLFILRKNPLEDQSDDTIDYLFNLII